MNQDICSHFVGVQYRKVRREVRVKNVHKDMVRRRIELIQELKKLGFCKDDIRSLLADIESDL